MEKLRNLFTKSGRMIGVKNFDQAAALVVCTHHLKESQKSSVMTFKLTTLYFSRIFRYFQSTKFSEQPSVTIRNIIFSNSNLSLEILQRLLVYFLNGTLFLVLQNITYVLYYTQSFMYSVP